MSFRVFHIGETKVVHFRTAQGVQTDKKLCVFVGFTVRECNNNFISFGFKKKNYLCFTHFRKNAHICAENARPGGESCAFSYAAGCNKLC